MRHHRHHQDTKAAVLYLILFEGTARPCYTKAADGIGDYVANFGKSPGLPNGGGRGNSPPLPITATAKPSPSQDRLGTTLRACPGTAEKSKARRARATSRPPTASATTSPTQESHEYERSGPVHRAFKQQLARGQLPNHRQAHLRPHLRHQDKSAQPGHSQRSTMENADTRLCWGTPSCLPPPDPPLPQDGSTAAPPTRRP